MTIAPIVREVSTRAPPALAFALFTARTGDWWPRAKTIGKQPHRAIVMEPKVGGRWYEVDDDGVETLWGAVLAWEPPRRALLAWRINAEWTYDPDLETEVEILFEPLPDGGARVRLEHRHLERFGDAAERIRAALDGGWPTRLGDFATFADETVGEPA